MLNRPFLVAQISDLHLKAGQRLTYGVVDTLGALRRAVDPFERQPTPARYRGGQR